MKKFLLITLFLASALAGIVGYQTYIKNKDPVDITDTNNQVNEDIDNQTDVTSIELYAEGVMECDDCWLAPVDKKHTLSEEYVPDVEATGLTGGGSMTPEAAEALRALFKAAKDDGIENMSVRSAYRSYDTQIITFEKWVGIEEASGLSREEAEIAANQHSARPGQSEHQLGTTVDILCSGCEFEDESSNAQIWEWLRNNALFYGFVMSYPEGKTEQTGYIHEPWHYRYIGTKNAAQFSSQSDLTLNLWLNKVSL